MNDGLESSSGRSNESPRSFYILFSKILHFYGAVVVEAADYYAYFNFIFDLYFKMFLLAMLPNIMIYLKYFSPLVLAFLKRLQLRVLKKMIKECGNLGELQ